MDLNELYHFLFETYPGIGVLVGSGLVLSILVCVILELNHFVDQVGLEFTKMPLNSVS